MTEAPNPFDCKYSPQFAELLNKLGISLAISTYQAGKIILLCPAENDRLIQLTRNYKNAMGMASDKNRLAVSSGNEVIITINRLELAGSYPNKKGVYDSIYIPSVRYNTGYLALHDMVFIKDKLIAANTLFSCLSYIDEKYAFTPFWRPPFISEISPEDRCHLNGIAVENDTIKYLTALGDTNSTQGWREKKMNGGILTEYPSGKIILKGLSMPHSPRIFDGKLYLLNSAQGELICVDPDKGTYEIIVRLGGFARGMAKYGDYLFIGVSKLRHTSEAFRDLPIAKTSFAGVIAVYLPYKSIIGSFRYEMSVDEIYDVKVIEGSVRPSILSPDMPVHGHAITTPLGSFWSTTDNDKSPENKNRQTISQTEGSNIQFQIPENVSLKDLAEKYKDLLFPLFLKKISAEPPTGRLLPVIVTDQGKRIALSVTEILPEKTALLHSLFVHPEYRRKGIAFRLSEFNDKILKENKIRYIDTSWPDIIKEADAFEKLLNKSNWMPAQKRSVNMKLDIEKIKNSRWFNSVSEIPGNDREIIDWANITEQDKIDINLLLNKDSFPNYLTPFQLPEITDGKISKVLRKKGKVAGWCIVHNVKIDTVQLSALYLKDEYRGKHDAMKLMVSAAKDAYEKNIRYVTYQLLYQHKGLVKYINDLPEKDSIINQFYTLVSRKYLSTKAQ